MKKFNYAIFRTPAKPYQNLESSDAGDRLKVIKEHETLIHFVKNVPVRVHQLKGDKKDCIVSKLNQLCIATEKCVILNNFSDPATNNQKIMLTAHLSRFYPLDKIFFIDFEGLVSSEDVLQIDDTFYVSLSEKTNQEGINQLSEILKELSYKVVLIQDSPEPLQKYLNYIEGNNLLFKENANVPECFANFNKIPVSENESSAIGAIWINDTIILPLVCEATKQTLININRYKVLSIANDMLNLKQILLKEFLVLF
ncbi:MAG: hypothetical protein HUJ42_01265 [Malacoplasma sp.]|nr:hypothetical protein [Malacoplasma sp.]